MFEMWASDLSEDMGTRCKNGYSIDRYEIHSSEEYGIS